jgi:two-component system, NarL family, sensor kinase
MIYLRNLQLVEHSRLLDCDAQIFCILFDIVLLLIGLAFRYRSLFRERLSLQVQRVSSMIQAEEKERSRLSKELNDSIGPLLAIAKIQLKEDIIISSAKHNFENTKAIIDEISHEVRNISHDLTPRTLVNNGLVIAIRDFVDRLNTTTTININLDISIKDVQIPKIIETALYCVLQEIMTNILKHSQTKSVQIQLIRKQNELTLMVQDDGIGFNTFEIYDFKGIGLKNIVSRIEFYTEK